MSNYVLHIATLASIFAIVSIAVNLLSGFTNLFSLAHGALFGMGAYVAAILSVYLGAPAWAGIVLAPAVGAIGGLVFGASTAGLRSDAFTLASLAFHFIVFNLFNNLTAITGGPLGIRGIPELEVFGVSLTPGVLYFALVFSVLTACSFLIVRIVRSPGGRVLIAMREDDTIVRAFGKSIAAYRNQAAFVSGGLSGLAGFLYAHYISFVDPRTFELPIAVAMLTMSILFGAGRWWSPVLGALVITGLPELVRFLQVPGTIDANARQIVYGGALIVFVLFGPSQFRRNSRFKNMSSSHEE